MSKREHDPRSDVCEDIESELHRFDSKAMKRNVSITSWDMDEKDMFASQASLDNLIQSSSSSSISQQNLVLLSSFDRPEAMESDSTGEFQEGVNSSPLPLVSQEMVGDVGVEDVVSQDNGALFSDL